MYGNKVTGEIGLTRKAVINRLGGNVSYPAHFTEVGDWVEYEETPRPEFDSQIQRCDPHLVFEDGWKLAWAVTRLSVEDIRRNRLGRIDAIHQEKLYSNVTVAFPAGPKVIQFRDERDRANLANVSQAAMALMMAGTPDAPMTYRTEDNENHMVTAIQMVGIAMSVLETKQAIQAKAWAHKDAIRLDPETYNCDEGW